MDCPSCKTPMLSSMHTDREQFGEYVISTTVYQQECPCCTAIIKTILPGVPLKAEGR